MEIGRAERIERPSDPGGDVDDAAFAGRGHVLRHKGPDRANPGGAEGVLEGVAADDVGSAEAAFIDHAHLVDQIVVADVAPTAIEGVIGVNAADRVAAVGFVQGFRMVNDDVLDGSGIPAARRCRRRRLTRSVAGSPNRRARRSSVAATGAARRRTRTRAELGPAGGVDEKELKPADRRGIALTVEKPVAHVIRAAEKDQLGEDAPIAVGPAAVLDRGRGLDRRAQVLPSLLKLYSTTGQAPTEPSQLEPSA